MHASSNFIILLKGTTSARNKAVKFLEKQIEDIDTEDNQLITVEETYEVVWIEDLVDMFKKLAKKIPQVEFVVSGYVDCSENSGEFMDFGMIYEDDMLTICNSDWLGYDNEDDDNNREDKFFRHMNMTIVDIDESFDEICTEIKDVEWNTIDSVEIDE